MAADDKKTPTPAQRAKAARAAARAAETASPGGARERPTSSLLQETGQGSFRERYVKAVQLGLNKEHCAAMAGCHPSTPREWECLAEEDAEAGRESMFTDFQTEIREALANLMAVCMGTVQNARLRGDWHAARWLLELNGYAKPKQVEVGGAADAKPIPILMLDEQDLQA